MIYYTSLRSHSNIYYYNDIMFTIHAYLLSMIFAINDDNKLLSTRRLLLLSEYYRYRLCRIVLTMDCNSCAFALCHRFWRAKSDRQSFCSRPQWCKGNYFDRRLQDVTASPRASLLISTRTYHSPFFFLKGWSLSVHNLLYNVGRVLWIWIAAETKPPNRR